MGFIITALLVGTMIVVMVKSNVEPAPVETLPSVEIEVEEIEETGLEIGKFPPDFELTTFSDKVIKLSDFKGKKVMLNFWASWCGPCKAEMPHMEAYYKKYKESDNVEIIAVNMMAQERNGVKGVQDFIDDYGLTFPIPIDEDGEVMKAYKVLTIPTTYLIGTDGKVAQKFVGPMDEKTIKNLVDNME